MQYADKAAWQKRRTYEPNDHTKIDYLGWPLENDLSGLTDTFEAFEPDPLFPWKSPRKGYVAPPGEWPIVEPVQAPKVPPELPTSIRKMMDATWEYTEPAAQVARGRAGRRNGRVNVGGGFPARRRNQVYIGARGVSQDAFRQYAPRTGYQAQTRLTSSVTEPLMPDQGAIAKDWDIHLALKRVNAVTFRADKRPPHEVIVQSRGFHPPNTRKDRTYIREKIAVEFRKYLVRRYQRDVQLAKLIGVIEHTLSPNYGDPAYVRPRDFDTDLLNEYVVWFSLVNKESAHLARMVDYEFEKGWISTSTCLDRALTFAAFGGTPGWVYVTVVHAGFVVPFQEETEHGTVVWGSPEAEIARLGPLRADQIVGFAHFKDHNPDSPIFMRKTFRETEPNAFKAMYQALSGARSTAL